MADESFKILSPYRITLLNQALAPQFLGRQMVNLVRFADEIADEAYDQAAVQIEPLIQFNQDLQSPAGAGMIGIFDAGNYFGGVGSVEDALQSAGAQIDALTGIDLSAYAPLDSPIFTGNPTAPTPAVGDNDNSLATTKFVKDQGYAPIASPVFTGDPRAPTPAVGDNDTSIATTAWVKLQGYGTGAGTGTVTSVAVANATGITWTGSPITTSGTLTPTLSANLQSWSGIAPATKADDSGVLHTNSTTETKTGILAASLAHRIDGGYMTIGSFSIATYGSGSCRVWWNNNATTLNFADATQVNISGDTLATDSGTVHKTGTETIGGAKTFTSNITASAGENFGGATASGGAQDLSRHISLHSSGYGFSITANNLNYNSPANHSFYTGSTLVTQITSAGDMTYKGSEVGWRNLNRVTAGVSAGQMYATTGGFTVSTGSAAGLTLYVYNNSASAITLTQGAGVTLRLSGTATTGNRTLAARGFATLWYNTTSEVICTGDVT